MTLFHIILAGKVLDVVERVAPAADQAVVVARASPNLEDQGLI